MKRVGYKFSLAWRGEKIGLELKIKVYGMAYKRKMSRTQRLRMQCWSPMAWV